MEQIIIFVCWFKRTADSKYERGICIGEGGSITDLTGKHVDNVYIINDVFSEGCFVITNDPIL